MKAMRWLGRGLGTTWALLFFAFFFGEGVLGPQGWLAGGVHLSVLDGLRQAALAANALALLAAWKWPRAGGWAGMAALAVFLSIFPRGFPVWAVTWAGLPTLLFVASAAGDAKPGARQVPTG